ncbi:MAG: hypothetical protein AAB449_03565 [Patescibacteria group bacterium]
MPKVIISIPCHFSAPTELCGTTISRMHTTLTVRKPGDVILLSGDVPYAAEGPTLGTLMRDWFIKNGVPEESLCLLYGGVGTFSEARAACQTVPHLEAREIVVVSSGWYLFAGKPIWRRRAAENNVKISFVSVASTGGWRTRLLYGLLGIVLRAGAATGFERSLEKFFTTVQQKRKKGFTLNGCA